MPHDPLPADDAAWDNGVGVRTEPILEYSFSLQVVPSNDLCILLSVSNSYMSNLAQAARLLGQVLKHVSNKTTEQALHDEKGMQLDRTLHAFIRTLKTINPPYYDPIIVCFRCVVTVILQLFNDLICRSALIALYKPQVSSGDRVLVNSDYYRYARTFTEAVSKRIVTTSPQYLPGLVLSSGGLSIWGIPLVYQASVTYIRLNQEVSTLDSLEALTILQQTLRVLNVRWTAAGIYVPRVCLDKTDGLTVLGTYLQVLEAREIRGIY